MSHYSYYMYDYKSEEEQYFDEITKIDKDEIELQMKEIEDDFFETISIEQQEEMIKYLENDSYHN